MFKPGDGFIPEPVKSEVLRVEHNSVIKTNDNLLLEIYTNNGEKLIDPNPELTQTPQGASTLQTEIKYLVDLNGVVKFPLIGELKLEGLTLRQAELLAQKEYANFYKAPFVMLRFNNKRVVVLGSPGGQVIPLVNEATTLAEVIALAKGIGIDGKANNIRVLRDDKIFLIDFTTIEGYKAGNIIIQSGDIVYVEPVRKPIAEGLRDYSFFLSFMVSITTLVILLTR
jgi:polysaccharide export outer membrane protein